MARRRPALAATLLLLVVVPFWTSFLVRVFAWKVLLHPDGALKHGAGRALGLVPASADLLYNAGAVLLVMIYTSLPFAILPIYAAAEKFDFTLVEAARDLGATSLGAFCPGVRARDQPRPASPRRCWSSSRRSARTSSPTSSAARARR